MGYNENALDRAIKDAEDDYGWDIDYEQISPPEEIGGGMMVYKYELIIEGQYAEDEAYDFFSDYDFYSVNQETTDYSYCVLTIEIDSAY